MHPAPAKLPAAAAPDVPGVRHTSHRSHAQNPWVAFPWHSHEAAAPPTHVPCTHVVAALHAAATLQLAPVYPAAHREQSSPL